MGHRKGFKSKPSGRPDRRVKFSNLRNFRTLSRSDAEQLRRDVDARRTVDQVRAREQAKKVEAQKMEQVSVTASEQNRLATPKVKPTEVKSRGGKLVDQIFPVQTKIVTRDGKKVVVKERGLDVVSLPTKGTRFILEKGTQVEDATRRALGMPESKKINVNPRDLTLSLAFIPAFASTGFTKSFQTKVVPQPQPKPITTSKTTQIQSGGLTRDTTITKSFTPARQGTITTDIGQALGFKPIGTKTIAPARTSISSVKTVTVGGQTLGTGKVQTTTGTRTFNQNFNIQGSSNRITEATKLNPAQTRTFKSGLLETQKGATIKEGTQFNQFTTSITKVSPTPKLGKSTTEITGTGGSLRLNKNTFLTKTGSVDISRGQIRGTNLQTTKGATRVVNIPTESKAGTTIVGRGGGFASKIVSNLKTSQISQAVGGSILPKTAPRSFVSASVAPPTNFSNIVSGIVTRIKPKQRPVQTQVISQSPASQLAGVNVVDFGRPRPPISIPRNIPRGTSTTSTPAPPRTPTITIPDVPPPTGGGGGIGGGGGNRFRPPTFRTPPPIALPLIPSFGGGIPRRSFGARRRRFADVPSFSALAFGIRGSGGSRGISGLGFKPIPKGFSFENIFDNKKKKKRRKR